MNGEHTEIVRRISRVEDHMVTKELLNARLDALESRLKGVEEAQRWSLRLIISQVVVVAGGVAVIIAARGLGV